MYVYWLAHSSKIYFIQTIQLGSLDCVHSKKNKRVPLLKLL